MSELTKKRVRWKEYNGEELLHDEDVDILTSADSVTFSDDETLQYKYTQGQFVNPSTTGILSNLSTTNKSSLVDAVNEIKTNATTNTSSINSLATRMNTAENDIDSLETRVTPITKGGTGATTSSGALSNLGITATASELNILDGITATTTELNYVDGVTSNIQTQLNGKANSSHNHNASNITSGTLPIARGGTGATTTSGILTNLGITSTASELNVLDGITATTSELNVLDGITATTTELNYTDGVTSNIQTQLNGKANSSHNHSASNITSGTLPITRGGTGATTTSGILTNLGITATASELNKLDGVTATTTELNYVDGVTSNIQTQLNEKALSSQVPFIEAGEWYMSLNYWAGGGPSGERIWCFYYRIGDFVHVTGGLHITSSLESGKQLLISNLPYTSLGFAVGSYIVNNDVGLQGATKASNIASLGLNKNFVTLKEIDSSKISNGDYIALSITYKVS